MKDVMPISLRKIVRAVPDSSPKLFDKCYTYVILYYIDDERGGRRMIKISVRELAHNLTTYIDKAQAGERIVVTKRNKPMAVLSYYSDTVTAPSWKKAFKPVHIKGEPASKTILKARDE